MTISSNSQHLDIFFFSCDWANHKSIEGEALRNAKKSLKDDC